MDRDRLKYTALVVLATLGTLGVGFVVFLYSGFYPIAAIEQHWPMTAEILTTLQQNAVERRAGDDEPPSFDDPDLLRRGVALYQRECVVCHGAPGVRRELLGRGLNPDPPRLATEVQEWTDNELFWIIKNGLKMAGMPGFAAGMTDRDVWAVTAVTRRLPTIDPLQWQRIAAGAASDSLLEGEIRWAEIGRGELEYRAGDPERGKWMIEIYGCGSCHVVPGVPLASGKVGPPLEDFGERHYIAGLLLNRPANLMAFIMNPPAFEPHTAMPALGVLPEDAWDMAAYLLTLGDGPDLGPPHPLPKSWIPLPAGKDPRTIAAPRPGGG